MRGEDNHDKNERILDRCRGGQEVVVQTVNINGGHVMPTISADEFKGAQAQKDNGGGYCVHSFVQLRAVRESFRGSDRRALRDEMQ